MIVAATYTNPWNTAAVVEIDGEGLRLASENDTPELWAEMLAWGEPTAYAPPPVPFPSVVTAAQAKIALFSAGLLDQVKTAVAAHPYELVRIWYADANDWERGNPYVQALGVELGLDDAAIDALFIAASKV